MKSPCSAEKKKTIERHYLDELRAAMPDFPAGRIEPTEGPDFLVHGENSIVGIELTELHRETPNGVNPQQAIEAMRRRVVAKAQELYIASNLPAVSVWIFMNDSYDIKKEQVLPLAKKIRKLVASHLPDKNASQEIVYDLNDPDSFPDSLIKLSVRRRDAITETCFMSPGATWISAVSDADIERVVEPKERKYSTYRIKCDATWLVVNADISSMSTWFEFESLALLKPLRTQFEREFILRHFEKRLFELPILRE